MDNDNTVTIFIITHSLMHLTVNIKLTDTTVIKPTQNNQNKLTIHIALYTKTINNIIDWLVILK